MTRKARLSASVDGDLLAAGERAVADGRADSLSAWVNEALALKVEHDRRLEALAGFIADYEAEHGVISQDEIRAARRRFGASAVRVRALTANERIDAYGARDEP